MRRGERTCCIALTFTDGGRRPRGFNILLVILARPDLSLTKVVVVINIDSLDRVRSGEPIFDRVWVELRVTILDSRPVYNPGGTRTKGILIKLCLSIDMMPQ